MKLVKRFSYLIMGILLCFSWAITVSAADYTESLYSDFFDTSEFEEVQEAVLNSDFLYEKGVLDSARTTADREEQLGDSYKIHTLTQPDLLTALQNGEDIFNIISNDYTWIVPTSDNESIRVDDIDGKWEVIGYSTPASVNAVTGLIQMDTLDAGIATFETDVSRLSKLICFEAPMYHTNFVYMRVAEDEVLIPYGSRPDLTGLENGKLYSPQEVSDILSVSFEGVYADDENAGTGTRRSDAIVKVFLSIIILFTLVGVGIYMIRSRRAH